MMNSLFGKTMEDVRAHKKTKFVKTKKLFQKYAFHPLCDNYFRLGDDAMVMNLLKSDIELNKPIYIGQCVLDFSKIVMYKLLDQWKENPMCESVQLIGGDTDSFFMEVTSIHGRDDILRSMSDIFDSSNYPKEHPLYSEMNKARLGCFKDEAAGKEIEEFVCLAPKSYSYKYVDNHTDCRLKGVKEYKKKEISHDDYLNTYLTKIPKRMSQKNIQSQHHVLRTVTIPKVALNTWEDKRNWIGQNESYPYGHYKLQTMDV